MGEGGEGETAVRELFARATVAWRARVNSEGERLQNVVKYTERRGVGIKQH